MILRFCRLLCLAVIVCMNLSGCVGHTTSMSASTPINKIIVPVKDSTRIVNKEPLTFPASVAVLMVPSQNSSRGIPSTTLRKAASALKQQLLANPKYVKSVKVVTEDPTKEKISLEKIRMVYGTDIAILLSYQQDQISDQSGWGFLDITIIGAFVVPGVETQTSSIIDGNVIHIPSNAIIFRASGTDERSINSTSFGQEGAVTDESIKSFLAATTDFGEKLTDSLSKFDNYDFSRAVPLSVLTEGDSDEAATGKPANDYWKRVDTYKSTGGGAFGIIPLLIALAVCCGAWRRR